jgi:hypothetical protein
MTNAAVPKLVEALVEINGYLPTLPNEFVGNSTCIGCDTPTRAMGRTKSLSKPSRQLWRETRQLTSVETAILEDGHPAAAVTATVAFMNVDRNRFEGGVDGIGDARITHTSQSKVCRRFQLLG